MRSCLMRPASRRNTKISAIALCKPRPKPHFLRAFSLLYNPNRCGLCEWNNAISRETRRITTTVYRCTGSKDDARARRRIAPIPFDREIWGSSRTRRLLALSGDRWSRRQVAHIAMLDRIVSAAVVTHSNGAGSPLIAVIQNSEVTSAADRRRPSILFLRASGSIVVLASLEMLMVLLRLRRHSYEELQLV
ncbi:hypothetical protein BCV70DRAFT_118068 [Testicularia cyperi]|uniref:Uncharacterized protein n=1 Tax=Testicularia cyperi TaxID=1882483 RepID=A0A317XM59_9BASI|nr:hypothetical protein BCV70DRAFT_118068 [Testicularia cyperi]